MKGSFSQKSGKTGWMALLCLLCLVASSLSVLAISQDKSDWSAQLGRGEMPALIDKANTDGTVRVVVALRTSDPTVAAEAAALTGNLITKQAGIAAAQDSILRDLGGFNIKEVKKFQFIPYMVVEADAAGLKALASSSQVQMLSADRIYYPSLAESAVQIGAVKAWNMGATGAGQTVVVIDTGVDKNHPFLRGKVVSEACYSTNDPTQDATSLCPGGLTEFIGTDAGLYCSTSIQDCEHGTHVAGIVAGKGRSFSGIAKDATIIAIKAATKINSDALCRNRLAPCAVFFGSDLASALEKVHKLAQTTGLRIAAVNMSLGSGSTYSANCDNLLDASTQAIKDAVNTLRETDKIATIVAAGNGGAIAGLSNPACLSNVFSVGATGDGSGATARDGVAIFSNCAPALSFLAPGDLITSSIPGVSYANYRGTSMAAPHVAAAWAILRGIRPDARIEDISGTLQKTALYVTDPKCVLSFPQIQLDSAVRSIVYELPGPSPTTTVFTATTTTTTTAFPTSTVMAPGTPYITANPSLCQIPSGQMACSATVQVFNPGNRSVQVWSKSPDGQEVAITGIFTTTYFGITAPWITRGSFTFSLYDVGGSSKVLLGSTIVTGADSGVSTTISTSTTSTLYGPPGPPTTLPASNLMLNVSCPQAAAGLDVVVPISMSTVVPGQGPISLQGDLSYDPAQMTYLGSANGASAMNSNKQVGVGLQYPGRLRFLVSGPNQNVIGDGVLMYLTFRVTLGVPAGSSLPLICSDTQAFNAFGQTINLGCASCSLPTQSSALKILR